MSGPTRGASGTTARGRGPARPRRVTVTSPETRLAIARRRHASEVPHLPHLAPVDLDRARRVHRLQLRRALAALAALSVLIVGLPVVLALFPPLDRVRAAGVPVSWLAVGVLPYLVLVSLAYWQLHRAEAAERPEGSG